MLFQGWEQLKKQSQELLRQLDQAVEGDSVKEHQLRVTTFT